MEPWLEVVKTFGLPVTLLVATWYGIVKIGRWAAPHAESTIATYHKTMERVAKSTEQSAATQSDLAVSMKSVDEKVTALMKTASCNYQVHNEAKR